MILKSTATWYGVSDVAKVIGVTPAMVRQLHDNGTLRCRMRTEGGRRLFHRADVEKEIRRRQALGKLPKAGQ